jgi:hypothetical protein
MYRVITVVIPYWVILRDNAFVRLIRFKNKFIFRKIEKHTEFKQNLNNNKVVDIMAFRNAKSENMEDKMFITKKYLLVHLMR